MPKRKPRNMTQEAWDYLKNVHDCGGWTVSADGLLNAAWLIEAGYARADDDYEGPRLYLTEAGTKLVSD